MLRKARLAADADMLVAPPQQNALHFYERALSADPGHPAANQEAEAILARVSLRVLDDLAAGDLETAYNTATVVARIRPDHTVVMVTQQAIEERTDALIAVATSRAANGDRQGADDALAQLDRLPGLQPEFLATARDTISTTHASYVAAEIDRLEAEQIAAEQATTEWTARVRGAIKSGRLVSPAGDSARDYLAELGAPKDKADELTGELVAALMDAGSEHIQSDPLQAEVLVAAAGDLRPDAEGLVAMRERIERRIIEDEGSKVLELSDFVRIHTPPARYPRIANIRNLPGWVDVTFTVTQTGATADIQVVQSEPAYIFDAAAIEAVEEWRFQPRVFRGQLIDQRASARVTFRLE